MDNYGKNITDAEAPVEQSAAPEEQTVPAEETAPEEQTVPAEETAPAEQTIPNEETAPAEQTKKKKGGKVRAWFKAHLPTKRRLIQLYAALLTNANIKGFVKGGIYRAGGTKYLCTPGLNCYSCPGAVGSCPLGSLQNALAASRTHAPMYVLGIILLMGLLLGRAICGFLCPVGLGQELLYKIKTPKLKKNRYTRIFSYFKYVLLVVLVIAIPLIYGSVPAFCEFICPAGTFGGALGLLVNPTNENLFYMLKHLFTWKFCVLVACIVACIFIYRFFCRFLCPLGAIYGFFNKFSLLGIKLDKKSCIDCGMCVQTCKMDVKHVGDHECISCGECISVCPTKAIRWKGSKLFVHPSVPEAGAAAVAERPLGAMLEEKSPAAEAVVLQTGPAVSIAAAASGGNAERAAKRRDPERIKKRNKWLKIVAWALAGIVLVFALVYYNFLAPETNVTVYGEGDRCPDFTLTNVFQTQSEHTEEFSSLESRGKVLVINFWYTTCTPCVAELPHFEKVKEDYGESVEVVAVHSPEVLENIQKFIDTPNQSKESWSDWQLTFALDRDLHLYETFGGKGSYPHTVIVKPDGFIYYIHPGELPEDLLRTKVEEALAT